MTHLAVLPVILPLAIAALIATIGEERRALARGLGLASTVAQLAIALALLAASAEGETFAYRLGDWPAPFGIVLVVDRLAALMLVITASVSLAGLVYAYAEWDERGRHFHALWQLQAMGLNGAFLTGDLFNLFVFFEVLLAASYCLLTHGRGRDRAQAAVHYVVLNLTASAVFLIAVALLYSVTGTLNMAHLALRVAEAGPAEVPLIASAGLMLLVVFAVKAALFPLYFWLPASYPAASAPVACLFAIMTKVGAYSILRIYPLVFGSEAGLVANLADAWLLGLAIATMLTGALGALSTRTLRGSAAYLTITSVGTLFLPIAHGSEASLGAATYYLAHSTLATAAMFLVAEMIARTRDDDGDRLTTGTAMPRSFALALGLAFALAAGAAIGLPPTSGFLGKLLVLRSVEGAPGFGWQWAAVLLSSFVTLVAVSRVFSVLFWSTDGTAAGRGPRFGWLRIAPAVGLLALAAGLVVGAGAVVQFGVATSRQLLDRSAYVTSVLGPDARNESLLRTFERR